MSSLRDACLIYECAYLSSRAEPELRLSVSPPPRMYSTSHCTEIWGGALLSMFDQTPCLRVLNGDLEWSGMNRVHDKYDVRSSGD